MKKAARFLAPMLATALAALSASAVMAQETAIALPVNGQLILWDMGRDPPAASGRTLPADAIAGGCHPVSRRIVRTPLPTLACLGYYTSDQPLGRLEPFTASGRIAFNDVAPNLAFRGLELRGVEGIGECGERDDCSTVYLASFANIDVTAQAMAAARTGRRVTLIGRKVWNAESIDMIVERVIPIR